MMQKVVLILSLLVGTATAFVSPQAFTGRSATVRYGFFDKLAGGADKGPYVPDGVDPVAYAKMQKEKATKEAQNKNKFAFKNSKSMDVNEVCLAQNEKKTLVAEVAPDF